MGYHHDVVVIIDFDAFVVLYNRLEETFNVKLHIVWLNKVLDGFLQYFWKKCSIRTDFPIEVEWRCKIWVIALLFNSPSQTMSFKMKTSADSNNCSHTSYVPLSVVKTISSNFAPLPLKNWGPLKHIHLLVFLLICKSSLLSFCRFAGRHSLSASGTLDICSFHSCICYTDHTVRTV